MLIPSMYDPMNFKATGGVDGRVYVTRDIEMVRLMIAKSMAELHNLAARIRGKPEIFKVPVGTAPVQRGIGIP